MQNYGLLPDLRTPEERARDYVFGATAPISEVLQPDGQWLGFLPSPEYQNVYFETMACVTYSATNCLEILLKRKYNLEINWSDRFTAKMSGTTSQGNSLYNVAESLRKIDGEIRQDLWPNNVTTWGEFYADIPTNIKGEARKGLDTFLIQYEFLQEPLYAEVLKQALTHAPLQITIFAYGTPDANGVYHNVDGMVPNHAVELVGYVDGQYWIIEDHYVAHETRKLAWDYRLGGALKFNITKKSMVFKKEKTSPNIYLIANGKKIMVLDMPTLTAIGDGTFEEVDSLANYPDGGTISWYDRIIN